MENYLQYLNASPTIFFQCRNEEDWPVDFVTDNIAEILGYKASDFLSSKVNFIDIVFDEDKEQILKEVTFLSNTSLDKYEFKPYRVITKDKRTLWVQDITKLIRDKNGKTTHFFCYITDITNQIKLHEQLTLSEDIISTIYNNSFQFIGLMTKDGTLIKANNTSLSFIEVEEKDVVGKKFWDCPWWNHSKREQAILKDDIKRASKGEFIRTNKVHYSKDGQRVHVDFSIKPVFNQKGEVVYLIPEGHDMTKSIKKEKQLNRHIEIIDENVLISTTDLEGKIISFSQKFASLCEFSKEELLGQRHNIMKHPDNRIENYEELWQTITKGKIWRGEHKNISKSGKIFWVENVITPNFDEDGEIISYTSIYKNITDKKEIEELLVTDVLTNIYNRRHFNTVFDSETRRCRRMNTSFVLMILDIDFFKQYNDTYGHLEGDNILIEVSKVLKAELHRPMDYLFRIGGEEFAIVTSGITKKGAKKLAKRLKKSVENLQIKHKGSEISKYLTVSIGVKFIDENDDLSCEEIYKRADEALYKVKGKGRNSVFID